MILIKLKIDICVYRDFGHRRVEDGEQELEVVGYNLEEGRDTELGEI